MMLQRVLIAQASLFHRPLRNHNALCTSGVKNVKTVGDGSEIRKKTQKTGKRKIEKHTKYNVQDKASYPANIKPTGFNHLVVKITNDTEKIANDRFIATPAREIAAAATSFLRRHFLEDRGRGTEEVDFKISRQIAPTEKTTWGLLMKMHAYNSDVAAKLDVCQICGEDGTQIFNRVAEFRMKSLGSKSLIHGNIIYSVPNVYNLVLRCLAREGHYSRAIQVLDWIHADGLRPNYDTYLYILESMGRRHSEVDILEIIDILKKMDQDKLKIEEMMWHGRVNGDSLRPIMLAIRQVFPNFKPASPTELITQGDDILTRFPVLQRCLSAKISSSNHLHGVQSAEELMKNFGRQMSVEFADGKSIKPIAIYKPHPNEAIRERLAKKYADEEKLWKERLATAFEAFRLSEMNKDFHISLYPFLKLLPSSTFVNIMLEEMRQIISRGNLTHFPAFFFHQNLGRRVFKEFLLKQRKDDSMSFKLREAYRKYIAVYAAEERDEETLLHSRVWQSIRANHINGLNMDPVVLRWPATISKKLGRELFQLMYDNIKFDPNINGNGDREEIPALYETMMNDGVEIKEDIKVHPKLQRWYELAGLTELWFPPEELPMLCPPIPWVRPEIQKSCGFLLNSNRSDLVRRSKASKNIRIDYDDRLTRKQMSPVLDAINAINAVAWKVNAPVLDVITRVFRAGGDVAIRKQLGLPLPLEELPDVPNFKREKSLVERSRLWQLYELVKKERNENYSLWADTLYRLSIANAFREETFWFPQSMDFRGRVYPCSGLFNHMGSDLSRSLLLFAKGKPLGPKGLDWLLVHIINLTGMKKKSSLDDRLAYSKSILDDIIDSAEEPLTGRGWWRESDDPWQTLAVCKEIAAVLKSPNPEHYVSHLPVHQDGSCNGLQHYAAIGRDAKGAECVNLINRETPKDVYSDMVNFVEEQRRMDAENGVMIAQKLEGYVLRKVIKQSVMTTVYGVTMYGASSQIARQLRDFDEFPVALIKEASAYLAKHTLKSINRFFTASTSLQHWLVSCAHSIVNIRNAPVTWETPLGMYVSQPYVSSKMGDGKFMEFPTLGKQKRAFPPNFIHSLDSTHMMLTAMHCYRVGVTFSAVHDCFWTHAGDVDRMNKICREQFVALHQQPLVANLSTHFEKTFAFTDEEMKRLEQQDDQALGKLPQAFNAKLKTFPGIGDFDLNEVLKSTYFFG